MFETSDFRRGLKIEYRGDPYTIVDFQHVNPGKGAAFTRTKIRNLRTAQVLEVNIKSGERVGKPDLEQSNAQYLYHDAEGYNFMDTANYEQFTLEKDQLGDVVNYMLENSTIDVLFYQGKPLTVECPTFVELTVKETQPGIRGDTATGGSKSATMETGLVINCPLHINEGDILKIDTRDGSYLERVNRK